MKIVTVHATTSYCVCIGKGLLQQAGKEIKKIIQPCKVAILSDDNVAPLYADIVCQSLQQEGFSTCVYAFPAGEASKRIHTLSNILEYLAQEEITRQDLIIALGGGVVGDMAGFSAAIYQRGVRFVQIPTTFLAAIDSSVGGKTAIDLEAGKTLAGAFYQPQLVLCDTDVISSLPKDIFSDGIAEAIKYGVLGNRDLFAQLQTGDFMEQLEDIIESCVSMKRDIVQEDEFDNGKRQLLNLGHTFGHAIEHCSHFKISHGHAVAIGMHWIARAAEHKGIAKPGTAKQIAEALRKNHLPLETEYAPAQIASGALLDKKRRGDNISFVFPLEIGNCIIQKVPISEVPALADLAALAVKE